MVGEAFGSGWLLLPLIEKSHSTAPAIVHCSIRGTIRPNAMQAGLQSPPTHSARSTSPCGTGAGRRASPAAGRLGAARRPITVAGQILRAWEHMACITTASPPAFGPSNGGGIRQPHNVASALAPVLRTAWLLARTDGRLLTCISAESNRGSSGSGTQRTHADWRRRPATSGAFAGAQDRTPRTEQTMRVRRNIDQAAAQA